ncbi:ribonuclease HI family protein [Comamonas piscis]|uniref:Ribonuclease HI family protein n=1 Tax=Comamonas piscis TaxID=1562974 RepID=A0A7G5EIJ2_9BURK|nr:ribonuclease HI family protein [Comamonas piscis]QMV73817.1 ribonuclease HI family protein [Comamonas piscis]WSO32240.1 ribonuclease HI family protein [Comamonas piscis]
MSSATWIAYIDGSALPNPGRMRIGGIAYAPDGASYPFSQALAHTGCNNEAEAVAAIHALTWLQSMGAREVLLHTDSSILAAQMAEPAAKPIARLAALYDQARALRAGFAQLEVRWVPRHKNTVADALARGDAEPSTDTADRVAATHIA